MAYRWQHRVRRTAALVCLALGATAGPALGALVGPALGVLPGALVGLALGGVPGVAAAAPEPSSQDAEAADPSIEGERATSAASADATASSAEASPDGSLSQGGEAFSDASASRRAPPDEPLSRLAEAFRPRREGEPLDERVERVRSAASDLGLWSAEVAARGLLLADGLGDEAARARAAVRLAPGLPAAWGALAVASPGFDSGPALARGLVEMERHLDASLWWRATAWRVLAWGLALGSVLFLLASALRLAPAAAHDLAHRLPGDLPPHAWAAVLASVGVLPAVLGEGLVGLAAGAFAVALPWASGRHRAALLASLAALAAAVHPVTAEAGHWIAALRADPVIAAIRSAETGRLSPLQRERLVRRAPDDAAASHALALWSKRLDRLDEAERWLEVADARESGHPVLLNTAANVRLARGDADDAIALYQSAVGHRDDAVVLFNLSQVHGSRIELGEQEVALEAAHQASAATVRELADLRGEGPLAVDLFWPAADLRARLVRAADGRAVAATLREPFGTGRLVRDPWAAPALVAGLLLVAGVVGRGREPSRVCGVCHARRCGRCVAQRAAGCALCGAPEGPPALLDALARLGRPLAVRVVPGLAGLAAGKPFLGWLAACALATAGAAFALREGVVPDPLAAGLAGEAAFLLAAALLAAFGAAATAWPLRGLR